MDMERETKLRRIPPNLHLKISLSIIYYLGTWPPYGKYRQLYALNTVFFFGSVAGNFLVSESIHMFINRRDLEKIGSTAPLFMTNLVNACKMFLVLYKQKRIQALLDITNNELFSRDNDKYERILTRYTWNGILHHIAFQSVAIISISGWAIGPISNLLGNGVRVLSLEGWYPYNETASPFFEITHVHQILAIVIASVHNIALDTLVTGLITVACCQFTLLNRNFASINNEIENEQIVLKNDINSDEPLKNYYRDPYKELKVCAKHCNMIFDFSYEIQDIFGPVIFMQLFVNCIIVCLAAFNIAQMKVYDALTLIAMVMYLFCMAYQIFIYCWHGNELHLHSDSVVFGAYSSNWWQGTKKFKKGLEIIMIRNQRPFILLAGNIMQISLQTFTTILRMSYSIFTVLQQSVEN